MLLEEFKRKYRLNDIEYAELCLNHGESLIEHGSLDDINAIVLGKYPQCLKYLRREEITDKVCDAITGMYLGSLSHIPNELRTKKVCKIFCSWDRENLQYVPDELLTIKLCKEIFGRANYISKYTYNEEFFKKLSTLEGYEDAFIRCIQCNGDIIDRMPRNKLTRRMYEALFEEENGDSSNISKVPEDLRDYDMCMLAVKAKTSAGTDVLYYVPKEVLTYEMAKIAVTKSPLAMMHLPNEPEYDDLYEYGVKTHKSLQYVPECKRTRELCDIAIKLDGRNVQYSFENDSEDTEKAYIEMCKHGLFEEVPVDELTEDMCIEALRAEKSAHKTLMRIPESLRTERVYTEFVRQRGKLTHVSGKTRKQCKIAVKLDPINFKAIPKRYLDEEMIVLGIHCGCSLEKIDKTMRTKKVCIEYIKKKSYLTTDDIERFVPDDVLTEEFFIEALQYRYKEIYSLITPTMFNERIMDELLKGDWVKLNEWPVDCSVTNMYKFNKLCRYVHKRKYIDVMNELVYAPINNFPEFKKLKAEFDEIKNT